MPTNLTPINAEGQPHGYWETYWSNGNLACKGHFVNGIREGYWEEYFYDGTLKFKGSIKNHKSIGFWYYFNGSSLTKVFYAN